MKYKVITPGRITVAVADHLDCPNMPDEESKAIRNIEQLQEAVGVLAYILLDKKLVTLEELQGMLPMTQNFSFIDSMKKEKL